MDEDLKNRPAGINITLNGEEARYEVMASQQASGKVKTPVIRFEDLDPFQEEDDIN